VRDTVQRSLAGINLKRFWGAKYKGFPSVINRQELVALLRAASDYAPRRLTAVETVEVFMLADELAAVNRGTETQLYAYYAFGEIAHRFCAPARVTRPDIDLKLRDFVTTLEGTLTSYQGFRELFLLNLVARDNQLTREDAEGLYAIDQVLSVAQAIVAACDCMSNFCLWTGYKRLAAQESYFVNKWREVVLAQGGGRKYPPPITDLIERVRSLIESTSIEGIHGLLAALADNDLYEANLAQIKINQSFNISVATGAHGSLTVTYTTAPVLPPGSLLAGPGAHRLVPGTYIFSFTINATIDKPVTLQLSPSIAANGWSAELWDETADSPRSSDMLPMPQSNSTPGGISRDIRVRVTVPTPTEGVPSSGLLLFDVTETSGSGGVPPGHAELMLTIGQEIPRPDTRVSVSLGNIGTLNIIGSRLTLPRNTLSGVQFLVRFLIAGQFHCALTNANTDQAEWTRLGIDSEDATFNIPGTPGEALAGGPVDQIVPALLHPGAAAQNTDLLIRVQSTNITGSPVDQRFRLSVAIQG
jgi:hypothetical protein